MKNHNHIFFLHVLFIWFQTFKYCKLNCLKNAPFLIQGHCAESCSAEDLNNKLCIVENEIIKTQWINKIYLIGGNGFNYINLAESENNDLFVLVSSFPKSNERILFGLTNKGEGYFSSQKIKKLIINDTKTEGKYETDMLMVKLASTSSTKEYLLSFARTPQYTEIYDLESEKIYFGSTSTIFYPIYAIYQLLAAYFKLTTSDYNYYLIGLKSLKYDEVEEGEPIFSLIKYRINSLNSRAYSINLRVDTKIEVKTDTSKYLSCYELPSKMIICFYKNERHKYVITPFTSSLVARTPYTLIENGDKNDEKYFKCVHFTGESGAFLYYDNNDPPQANIVFKKYSSNSLSNSFSPLSFDDYYFYYNSTMSEIIKVKDKKLFFVAISLDKTKLYIVSIINYDQQKLMKRVYEVKSLLYDEYYFYNIMRIMNYKNYLAFGFNGFRKDQSFTALIIFSYPNKNDTNIVLSDYLLNFSIGFL